MSPAPERPDPLGRWPRTAAGGRLFTDNEPMDMMESNGVTWDDIRAVEEEAAHFAAAPVTDAGLREAERLINRAAVVLSAETRGPGREVWLELTDWMQRRATAKYVPLASRQAEKETA